MTDRLVDGLNEAALEAAGELPEEERELLAACIAAELGEQWR